MLAYIIVFIPRVLAGSEANPPSWPSSVHVFGPSDPLSEIEQAVNAAWKVNGGITPAQCGGGDNCIDHGQFSQQRYAFLFKPGSYNVEVPVGYYTQVMGLGTLPTDVRFTSERGVYCEESNLFYTRGALDTFWRSAENFQTDAFFAWNGGDKGMIWAASQGTSLRRIVVTNNLDLYEWHSPDGLAGFASGGFISNSIVKGERGITSGSQQQYTSRNNEVTKWQGGVWDIVNVGTTGAPESHCGAQPGLVTVDAAPLIVEKPFISIDASGKYKLNIPQVAANRAGTDFGNNVQVDFEDVYVASASESAASINSKLQQGLHVVLSPGVYNLDAPLNLSAKNQVLLGLGLATLVAMSGTPVITVGNVDGVRIAGILLQGGPIKSDCLLDWGDVSVKYAGSGTNPGALSDVFARTGGPAKPIVQQSDVMVRINSGNVIIDNAWYWRADHTETKHYVTDGSNPSRVGLVVNGDDVIAYGLMAEHSLTDQVQWNGENGRVYMYQSELPYDVTQDFADKGYVSYRVGPHVQKHLAYGVGVYHNFYSNVHMHTAIRAPQHLETSFIAPLAVFLNGHGVVDHVINDLGEATRRSLADGAVAKWYCDHAPPAPSPPPAPTPPPPPAPTPLPSVWRPCFGGVCCNPHTAIPQFCPGGIRCHECGGGDACQCPSTMLATSIVV